MKTSDFDVAFIDKDQISPGGLAAFCIVQNGNVIRPCIGSGSNFRDAKALALANLKKAITQVKAMKGPE